MKWSVAPAVILAALGVLSVAAAARAAVGDAAEGELLGGPDQPNYMPPSRSKPPQVNPTAAKPPAKAPPQRQSPATPAFRPAPTSPPQRSVQVTPPAPWRSTIDARQMPQVAAPDIPPEEEVAAKTDQTDSDRRAPANADRINEPPAQERASADRGSDAGPEISEADFAQVEQAIGRGIRRGALGPREAQWLYDELDDIAAMREHFLRAGRVTPDEHEAVAERMAALRDRIDGAGDPRWRGRRY